MLSARARHVSVGAPGPTAQTAIQVAEVLVPPAAGLLIARALGQDWGRALTVAGILLGAELLGVALASAKGSAT